MNCEICNKKAKVGDKFHMEFIGEKYTRSYFCKKCYVENKKTILQSRPEHAGLGFVVSVEKMGK